MLVEDLTHPIGGSTSELRFNFKPWQYPPGQSGSQNKGSGTEHTNIRCRSNWYVVAGVKREGSGVKAHCGTCKNQTGRLGGACAWG